MSLLPFEIWISDGSVSHVLSYRLLASLPWTGVKTADTKQHVLNSRAKEDGFGFRGIMIPTKELKQNRSEYLISKLSVFQDISLK